MTRCEFLSDAKKITDWSNVIFADKTWLNANHTMSKNWTNDTAAFTNSVPMGKIERLIICQARSTKGFVSDALLVFNSKKTVDYHEEMNAEVYEKWFKKMLQSLEESSIIIMDNASHNSRQIDKISTQTNKKKKIWNDSNDVAKILLIIPC